ncbi:MAG: hypothetical protein WCK09_20585, partial [Bacteroidota bacterium]
KDMACGENFQAENKIVINPLPVIGMPGLQFRSYHQVLCVFIPTRRIIIPYQTYSTLTLING